MLWLLGSYVMQVITDLVSSLWLIEWSGDLRDATGNVTDPILRLGVYGAIGAAQSK